MWMHGIGYTNPRNHLRLCVGDNSEQVSSYYLDISGGKLDNLFYSSTRDSDILKLI